MSTCDPACEDDAGLLRAWCERRDEAALAALFARHAPALRAIARRVLRDEAEAEDVVQEVLIRLSGHAGAIAGPVEPWLRQVAAHAAISALRSRNRRRAREAQAATPSGGQPVLPATGENLHDLVAECVAALTPAERDLVLRVFWGGEAQRDLARELRVSPVAVHKRLRVSLDNLRRLLARRGVRVGAAALLASLGQLCGQEPSAMAAQVRPPGWRGWAAGAGMAAGLALVASALLTLPALRSGPLAGGGPAPGDGPAADGGTPPVPAAARAVEAAEAPAAAGRPGAGPSFWHRRPVDGWSACRPADLGMWLGSRAEGLRRVEAGDPALRWEGGADPVLRCEVPPDSLLILSVPLPATYRAGSQLRLEHRILAGGDPPWIERVYCLIHAVELPEAPLVLAAVGGADRAGDPPRTRFDQPGVVGGLLGWRLEASASEYYVGLSPWRDPGAGFHPMADRPPWWPVFLVPGSHSLRRLQVRALAAGERQELVEYARAAPAERLSEQ